MVNGEKVENGFSWKGDAGTNERSSFVPNCNFKYGLEGKAGRGIWSVENGEDGGGNLD